jgi:hypothetical protein
MDNAKRTADSFIRVGRSRQNESGSAGYKKSCQLFHKDSPREKFEHDAELTASASVARVPLSESFVLAPKKAYSAFFLMEPETTLPETAPLFLLKKLLFKSLRHGDII